MSACSEKAQIDAVVNKQSQIINLVFNLKYPGGQSGPWSNSTLPEKSNVTMNGVDAISFVGGVVGGMKWDINKLNVTKALITFDNFKDPATNMISA